MKTLIFLFSLIMICNLSIAGKMDSLFIYNRLEKNQIKVRNINKYYTNDAEIDLFDLLKSKIDGFSVSGKSTLNSDSSLVRIILHATNKVEFLVYESTIANSNTGTSKFEYALDETFLLDSITPSFLEVQLIDSEVEIKKIIGYSLYEKNSAKRNTMKDDFRNEIHETKLSEIKEYIKRENLYWSPEINHFSTMPYRYKKMAFGNKYNTYGYEYYKDGFFSTPCSSVKNELLLKSGSTFVDNFDWRNRHGKNWITSNKCQSGCFFTNYIDCDYNNQDWNTDSIDCINDGGEYREVGTCWAFSAIGTLEAVLNLYFNQLINYDLSEQQVVSCAHRIAEPWYLDATLNYIRDNYVVNESCYPYIAANGDCDDVCSNPSDRVSFSSYSREDSESELKSSLISNGPLAAKMYGWSHVLVCVGWGTVTPGDYIDYTGGQVVQAGDPIVGSTYWILKQSNTKTGWPYHTGYIYMLDKPNYAYKINFPITSEVYDSDDIQCTDNDNDGYYFWGLGSRPYNCSNCCSTEPDGDDSNPNIGPIDAYGNPTFISTSCLTEVTTTETWTSSKCGCGNVVVRNGGNLTINGASINLTNGSMFYTETGGVLTITSGEINAN